MSHPVRTVCALVALMVLVTGCAGASKSPAYPIPPPAPPGEDTPSAEVSQNLALALGPASPTPETLEEKRATLPRALVGDRGNAVYSGERLTGSVTAPAAASALAPSAPAVPPAPVVAPSPPAVPRVAVEQQAAAAVLPATPPAPVAAPVATPGAAKPAPSAPPAPVANLSGAGRVTVQLAAFRTRANAEGGWQRLRAAHPDQLGDRALIMQETDLGDRGIYYRVRTGPFTDVAAAKTFCAQLRARDQDCMVISPQ